MKAVVNCLFLLVLVGCSGSETYGLMAVKDEVSGFYWVTDGPIYESYSEAKVLFKSKRTGKIVVVDGPLMRFKL